MKSRVLAIISLVLNAALVTLGIIGLVMAIKGFSPWYDCFSFFTIDSNILMVIAAIVIVVFDIMSVVKKVNYLPQWAAVFKMIATAMVAVTFLTVICYLGPTQGFGGYYADSGVFLHLICPVLAIIIFGFLEVETIIKWRFTFFGILPVILYGVPMIILCSLGLADDVYGFLNFNNGEPWYFYLLVVVIMVAGSYALAFVLWLLNKLFRLIIIGYVYVDSDIATDKTSAITSNAETQQTIDNPASEHEELQVEEEAGKEIKQEDKKPEESKKASDKKAITPASKVATEAKKLPASTPDNKYKDSTRAYHISRQKLVGKWQVKLANGERAIKLFKTQAEAIVFAKELVKTQGGSIRIHSMRGKLRSE